ncbi:MAG: hypothetical protein ACFFED_16075 [Candidatus Thorarchaeota archaeon]
MNQLFPQVVGSNLLGEQKLIPHDLDGEINILVVAFQQWQQAWVDSWVPTLENLVNTHRSIEYYELPTIRRLNFIARKFIDGGMKAGIPSKDTRRRTITLYIDKEPFKRALEIEKEDLIYIFVVQKDGTILFRTSGPYTLDAETKLIEMIESIAQ